MTFSDKVKSARTKLRIKQEELAAMIDVSRRSVVAWETTDTKPRKRHARRLAEILGVSEDYLKREEIADPNYGTEKEKYIEEVLSKFGDNAAKEMDELLERNIAFFASEKIRQEAKTSYFDALMKAYLTYKEKAKKKES